MTGDHLTAVVAHSSTRKTTRRVVLILLAAIAVGMLLVPIQSSSARFVWNVTASAPAGLYWIDHGRWSVGDRVAVAPSESLAADLDARAILNQGKLLIKRVAAGQGATVCRQGGVVTIDGKVRAIAQPASRGNHLLASWQGCIKLDAGDVFLLGDTRNSYDGRYFGVTSAEEILGAAQVILPISE